MKLYDLEHHFYDQSTIDAMAARLGKSYPSYDKEKDIINWRDTLSMPQGPLLKALLDVGENRIKIMDDLGITTAVLSTSQGVEDVNPPESIELAQKVNNAAYELTQRFPGRYLSTAILPTKDPDAAVKELERCVNELGFKCWHTHSNLGTDSLENEIYLPIFKKAAELGVYVYLHPNLPRERDLDCYGFTMAGPGFGFTRDTMGQVLKLIGVGLFDKIPELQMVVGHFGEAIPFLMDRIDNRMNFLPNPALVNKEKPSYYFKHNISVTCSGNMSPEAFECTKKVFGIDHIMFGSDYAFEGPQEMVEFAVNLDLTEEEREMFYYKNAEKLLKIQ